MKKSTKNLLIGVGIIVFIFGRIFLGRDMPERKVRIITTTTPLAVMAMSISEKWGIIETLVPPGTDPKTYIPNQKDLERLRAADILITNGAEIDPFAANMIVNAHNPTLRVIDAKISNGDVTKQKRNTRDNPYTWLSPTLALHSIRIVRDGLQQWDLRTAGYFQIEEEHYKTALLEEDKEFKKELFGRKGTVIEVGNCLQHFAEGYGLTYISLTGMDDLSRDLILKKGQKVDVFVSSFDQENARAMFVNYPKVELHYFDPYGMEITKMGYEKYMGNLVREVGRVLE